MTLKQTVHVFVLIQKICPPFFFSVSQISSAAHKTPLLTGALRRVVLLLLLVNLPLLSFPREGEPRFRAGNDGRRRFEREFQFGTLRRRLHHESRVLTADGFGRRLLNGPIDGELNRRRRRTSTKIIHTRLQSLIIVIILESIFLFASTFFHP